MHHSFWFDLPLLTGVLTPRNSVFRRNAQLSSLPQASPRDRGSYQQGTGERTDCKVVQPRNPAPQQKVFRKSFQKVFRKLSQQPSLHPDGDHSSNKKHFKGAESSLHCFFDLYAHRRAVQDGNFVACRMRILCRAYSGPGILCS